MSKGYVKAFAVTQFFNDHAKVVGGGGGQLRLSIARLETVLTDCVSHLSTCNVGVRQVSLPLLYF
jgi:hypothetical protein